MNLGLLNPIVELVNGIFVRRFERATERHNLDMAGLKAKAAATAKAVDNEASWESIMATKNTWMDDYWTVILSIPLVLVFFPSLQGHVKGGFDALAVSVPEWYVWALLASISAAFARKRLPDVKGWLRR